jgi:hypothetical protein
VLVLKNEHKMERYFPAKQSSKPIRALSEEVDSQRSNVRATTLRLRGCTKLTDGTKTADSIARFMSYPNEVDRERARKLGVDPGGDIMIHGITNGLGWLGSMHRKIDWTNGCIAVTDAEMDEIWLLVPDGTQVEIRP